MIGAHLTHDGKRQVREAFSGEYHVKALSPVMPNLEVFNALLDFLHILYIN